MKEIISVVNQKGGVAKTTTALCVASGIREKGYRVLLVDLDAQANLTYTMGIGRVEKTSYDAMINGNANGIIQETEYGVDLLPGGDNLSGADLNLSNKVGREYKLKAVLQTLNDSYDYIVIDTPPALGVLTVNALSASTGAIITAQADIYSLQGVTSLYETIKAVQTYCNPSLIIKGIVITRFNKRANIGTVMTEGFQRNAESMNTKVYKTMIRECTALKESQLQKVAIYTYAPRSNASKDYSSLVDEILEN